MKRTTAVVSMTFLFMSLTLFQNCADQSQKEVSANSVLGYSADYAPKELIIKMKTEAAYHEMTAWVDSTNSNVEYEWSESHMALINWSGDVSVENMMYTMNLASFSEEIVIIEPNYLLAPPIDFIDNPAEVTKSEDLSGHLSFSREDINNLPLSVQNQMINNLTGASELQGSGDIAKPVVVAVIDSGLDITHSYFVKSQAIWVNTNEVPGDGIDNDNNGRVDDVNGWNFVNENSDIGDKDGHGTHCAGVVLNVSNNIFTDNPSVSPIKIMPLKFIGTSGGKTSDAIKSIVYALNNGADILSNSWGGAARSEALMASLVDASNKGLFIALAAGNDSSNNDAKPVYPANNTIPNILTVAASTSGDELATFTNYGGENVDIAAPGMQVLSTHLVSEDVDKFRFLSGTSTATAYVAGTAAIMLNANSSLTGFEVKSIIISEADDVTQFQGFLSEASRVNSNKANESAQTTASKAEQPQTDSEDFAIDTSELDADAADPAGCGLVKPGGNNTPSGGLPLLIAILMFPLALLRKMKVISINEAI